MIRMITLVLILVCASFVQAGAQNTEVASAYKFVTPVFKNADHNPVVRIRVSGEAGSKLTGVALNLEGTDRNAIEHIRVYHTGDSEKFETGTLFGTVSDIGKTSAVEGEQELSEGNNFFWVSLRLTDKVSLLDHIHIYTSHLVVDGKIIEPQTDRRELKLKPGLRLRRQGQEGVDTYRIPGLVTTNKGTLIGVYDIRYENAGDLQGNIDVGISRSTDGGETWEPMQVIMDRDTWGGKPEAQNGVGDPAILVDRNTGTIWVAALWTHGMPGQRAWKASKQGLGPQETGQVLLVKSEDDGVSWSEPVNITRQIKEPGWTLILQGPGNGITMSDGTLVFAAQYKDADGMPYSTIMYSKDRGQSWNIGTGAKPNTTEAQVVELSDGSLMLNMRDNRGGARSVYTTGDLGKTWKKHPTSRKALREPVCMASLIQVPSQEHDHAAHHLLFSNPNSTEARKNMTVKLSLDDGMNWPEEHQLLLNEHSGYGYSALTAIDEHTFGILYEGVKELFFQKINIKELSSDF